MKLSRLVLTVAAVAAPTLAQAAPLSVGGPTSIQCLTVGSISSCASVNVSLVGSTFTAMVKSLSGSPTNTPFIIHSFGFYYFTATGTPVLTLFPTAGTPATQNGFKEGSPDLSGGEKPAGSTWLGGAQKHGSASIASGEERTFTFSLTGSLPGEVYFAFHGGSWDGPGDESSFKCYGSGKTTTADAACGPPTVVPEPGTVILLGTGLAGLLAGGAIRRRRRSS